MYCLQFKYKPVIYLNDETEVYHTVAYSLLEFAADHQRLANHIGKHIQHKPNSGGWPHFVFQIPGDNSNLSFNTGKLFLQ